MEALSVTKAESARRKLRDLSIKRTARKTANTWR